MSDELIVGVVSVIVPSLMTFLTAKAQSKVMARNAAKAAILQMIVEDHVAVAEGRLPTNYQNVLHEYDTYHANGGNSYVHDKVDEYKRWFEKVEEKHKSC